MIFSPCIFIIFRVAWVSSITMKEIRSHDQESGTCNFVCNAPVKQDIQTCNPRKQNLLVNAGINKIQNTYYSNGEERTINYHIKTIELFPFLFNQEAAKFINVKRTLPWHGAKSNIRPVVLVLQRSVSVSLNSMAFALLIPSLQHGRQVLSMRGGIFPAEAYLAQWVFAWDHFLHISLSYYNNTWFNFHRIWLFLSFNSLI